LSETELYTDVAFMYIILLGLIFLALTILLPRMIAG
jgi:hypothetical protein